MMMSVPYQTMELTSLEAGYVPGGERALGQAEQPGVEIDTSDDVTVVNGNGEGEAEIIVVEVGEETGFGWPAAVPVRANRWDFDVDPATYMIAEGDTYSGLAATYLGAPQRWDEIWGLNKAQHPDPDVIFPGDVIDMPDEAADNAAELIAEKGNGGGKKKKSALAKALPWVLGLGVGTGVLYVATR